MLKVSLPPGNTGNFCPRLYKLDSFSSRIPGNHSRSMSSNSSSDKNIMSATKSKAAPKSATKTPEPVVAAPVVAEKKTAKKAEKAPAPAPAPAPVAPAAPVAAETEAPADSAVLLKGFEELHEQLSGMKAALQTSLAALKTLEKQAARLAKKADRRGRRKAEATEGGEPKPCIFTKPVKVSAELCSFLALPKDSEVSRSAVTKAVMAYARAHNLMDKQTIKADAPLRKLLTLTENDTLTILNLQKFLRRHYVKPAVPLA